MAVPFTTVEHSPEQLAWDYDSYDKMAARLFNPLVIHLVDNSTGRIAPTTKRIPLIFSTPDRAWAMMEKKFEKEIGRDRNFRVPLPFLSLQQIGDTVFDPRRYLYKKILYRKVALNDDFSGCLSHPKPLPFTFQYAAELWVKTRIEARVACAQFASLFDSGGFCYRRIDHGSPLGVKLVPVFLEGLADNSSLETGQEQRSLRWSFSFRVEGWLAPQTIEQKLVHQINVSVDAPESICEEDIYEDVEVAAWEPMIKGNPDTGEVTDGVADFDPDYSGVDYRLARFSTETPCVEV